ncbi:stage III sporulation protein AG [Paenibacillus sp. FSL H7-0942]|jgi:stage III sporulation protein AG|uniref:Stage III sporulation protein AG n=1 Tax=Paenibacillus amylolyticus TaxID=1451 RepID=A0ABD8AMB6_PAEAM|nr:MULTISPECIES: stage III sporulation protein AG [Paenibacillus]APO46642.1 stage III sporulation protein AG [Paenibacillus xylanexedens]ETT29560.1 stage III sporulation protein AG [Paenibacillus sp. FSL R5-192]ETT44758.1 stage III sporulation protein AG [Paenibacillus sp. FSL H7-689]KLU55505.1 stage III sporulation protein AG [Paenibacillus sp. VT-400]OME98481.1 stage III sporulation protein AG [Paenibacillus amylolyticus]
MKQWFKKMETWMGGGEGGARRSQTFRWLIILGLIGVGIMLFNSFVNVKKIDSENIGREPPDPATSMASIQSDPSEQNPFQAIEIAFEDKIKGVLENIVGVGTVDVMVTVDSTEELVVQRNVKDSQQLTEETDASGGKRHMTQYTRDGEIITYEIAGDQTPIVTKKLKPQIRGVLVVARGAENKVVKDLITDAVEKGLNVAAYRISVVPRKQD